MARTNTDEYLGAQPERPLQRAHTATPRPSIRKSATHTDSWTVPMSQSDASPHHTSSDNQIAPIHAQTYAKHLEKYIFHTTANDNTTAYDKMHNTGMTIDDAGSTQKLHTSLWKIGWHWRIILAMYIGVDILEHIKRNTTNPAHQIPQTSNT